MGKYNFDQYIERRGTDSSKWDGFESRFPGYNTSGALPMWVADMDFTAPDGSLRRLWLSGTKGKKL